jgi:hypothetical protein
MCAVPSVPWSGQRLSLTPYVTGMGAPRGAIAAGGCEHEETEP